MLVWRAGFLKDAGKPNTTETSIAKLYATEAAVRCANTAIQVHGGSGYVDDHPVERYFRDVRVTTLYEGTSQIQKLIIGRALTGINALVPMSAESDTAHAPHTIGVVGAGTMGAGIAQLACLAGARTLLHDPLAEALERGIESIKASLERGAERGRLSADEATAAAARLEAAPTLEDLAAVRARDRGGARIARAQARAVRAAVGDRRRGLRARHQHLIAARDGDRVAPPRRPSASSACTSSTRRR